MAEFKRWQPMQTARECLSSGENWRRIDLDSFFFFFVSTLSLSLVCWTVTLNDRTRRTFYISWLAPKQNRGKICIVSCVTKFWTLFFLLVLSNFFLGRWPQDFPQNRYSLFFETNNLRFHISNLLRKSSGSGTRSSKTRYTQIGRWST